mmetsp:Transcript_13424/g.53898  ORF Transcript_13424/g.53898 Transcript_13424/m.53898 type:complete len:149 (-) Transcript_13424:27-473(-)
MSEGAARQPPSTEKLIGVRRTHAVDRDIGTGGGCRTVAPGLCLCCCCCCSLLKSAVSSSSSSSSVVPLPLLVRMPETVDTVKPNTKTEPPFFWDARRPDGARHATDPTSRIPSEPLVERPPYSPDSNKKHTKPGLPACLPDYLVALAF